jgi:hypothetical protein
VIESKRASQFAADVPLGEHEFPGGYIFSFLESFVALLNVCPKHGATVPVCIPVTIGPAR